MRYGLLLALLVGCGDTEGGGESTSVSVASPAHSEPVEEVSPKMTVATVGQPAPDFVLEDVEGNTVGLSDYRGKVVVLEWFNPDCPFVVYAHGEEGPLKTAPNRWIGEGVVWLAINSGAPGKQGHGVDRNRAARDEYGMDYPILLDESGRVGKLYQAKTTPGMYVVDADGVLAYAGALDNAPRGKVQGQPERIPYVDQALEAVLGGKAPPTRATQPYGCGVKYGS